MLFNLSNRVASTFSFLKENKQNPYKSEGVFYSFLLAINYVASTGHRQDTNKPTIWSVTWNIILN